MKEKRSTTLLPFSLSKSLLTQIALAHVVLEFVCVCHIFVVYPSVPDPPLFSFVAARLLPFTFTGIVLVIYSLEIKNKDVPVTLG